jgi:hypothetical protein
MFPRPEFISPSPDHDDKARDPMQQAYYLYIHIHTHHPPPPHLPKIKAECIQFPIALQTNNYPARQSSSSVKREKCKKLKSLQLIMLCVTSKANTVKQE